MPSDTSKANVDTDNRISKIANAAEIYGQRSFDNYAQIRSFAENLRGELCNWLSPNHQCVYLVPPEGEFGPQNYRSAAYSVSGQGYLPLKPISFGLAVRISSEQDFMRLRITCRKEGEVMFVNIEDTRDMRIELPATKDHLMPLFEHIYTHILEFFTLSVDEYDNGNYGGTDIGFDIMRITE
ncbi:MAG: hypothetical protein ABJG88_11725 [Litorimonas sp.]